MQDSDPNVAGAAGAAAVEQQPAARIARSGGFEPRPNGWAEKVIAAFSRKTIVVRTVTELNGLPVAVVGSARALGREVDRQHRLGIEFVDVATDEEGLAKLKRGEVAALFSTSGWPSGPVQALKRGDGLHLVRYDLKAEAPYQVVMRNYENVDAFRHPFLAAPNVMMSRPFTASGTYAKAVAALGHCLRKNLITLREGPYEPMWQEVKADGPTYGIKAFLAP